MPIAAIIDIVTSRKISLNKRKKLMKTIDDLIQEFDNEWKKHLKAGTARTAGDSVEALSKNWIPILNLLHRFMIKDINFRVGFGAGAVNILRESADECDGPAFWAAREALNFATKNNLSASYSIGEGATEKEKCEIEKLYLSQIILLQMSQSQRKYCYMILWENAKLKDIARTYGTSLSNISITLKRAKCRHLKQTIQKNMEQI